MTWLISRCVTFPHTPNMSHMTPLQHDSLATWLRCNMTPLQHDWYVCDMTPLFATWLLCDMTPLRVIKAWHSCDWGMWMSHWGIPFMSLRHVNESLLCDMTPLRHDSVATWLFCFWDMTPLFATWHCSDMTPLCLRHDSVATRLVCLRHDSLTWLVRATWLRCDMTSLWHDFVAIWLVCLRHDSLTWLLRATWPRCDMTPLRLHFVATWLVYLRHCLFVCGMTPCLWHARYSVATWLRCDVTPL